MSILVIADPYGCQKKKRTIESLMKSFPSFSHGAISSINRPKAVPSANIMHQRIKTGKRPDARPKTDKIITDWSHMFIYIDLLLLYDKAYIYHHNLLQSHQIIIVSPTKPCRDKLQQAIITKSLSPVP